MALGKSSHRLLVNRTRHRIWQATSGTYHATYSDYEFVHMISGRIVITPDGGAPVEVGPGDAFAVEADFKGTWKIIEPVTKHFVVRAG